MKPIIETRPFVRDDRESEIQVEFSYLPGTEPSGMFGPPENYDPGSGPEIELLSVTGDDDGAAVTLTDTEEGRIMDEIAQNPPEPDDDPDYYTQRKDERATGGGHDD